MKFILTKELGRLARWLRILGFDSEYYEQDNRSGLIITSLRDERIILTRDSRMSPVSGIRIVRIRHNDLREQISQVLDELHIEIDENKLFTICTVCNKELQDVDKPSIKDKVPEYVHKTQNNFSICPKCERVYWHGTHWGNVRRLLKEVGR